MILGPILGPTVVKNAALEMTTVRGSFEELSEFFEELYGDESDYDSEDESEEEVEESKAEVFLNLFQWETSQVSNTRCFTVKRVSIATKGREGGDEARKESNQNRSLAERGGPAT